MSDTAAYTIGWISAIEIEAAAALLFLDERHEAPRWTSPRDENDYTLGRIGSHNVVMASLPKGGNGTSVAATVARDMVFSFPNVRFCLMVGVGGGAPSERHDIRLGDIVVSTPTFYRGMGNENHGGVIEYNYGRTVEQGRFQSVRYLSQPPRLLLAAVQGLSMRYKIDGHKIHATVEKMIQERPRLWKEYRRPLGDTDRLYSSDGTPQERIERTQEEDNPMVHYGLIASADHFMENAQIRDLLAHQLDVLCFEMEAAGLMNNFPCLVIRGICDYSDSRWCGDWRGYAAMTAAAYAKDLIQRVAPTQVEAESSISQIMRKMEDKVNDIKGKVGDLRATTLDIDQKTALNSLPEASGAAFDSQAEEDGPTCLPDTRVDVLGFIREWALGPEPTQTILWLNGMAGTGKSTISRSICRDLEKNGYLGASFFFKRGEGGRGSLSRLFTTIASQLARRRPVIAPSIKRALDESQGIYDMGTQLQFKRLIQDPLRSVSADPNLKRPIIIVLDALDECDCDKAETLKSLIDLFTLNKSLGLRVFITSRPEWHIDCGFGSVEDRREIILHHVPENVVEHDMSVFFRHKLEGIRASHVSSGLPTDWPGSSNTRSLIKMATPLFIFADLICRFLADPRYGVLDDKMQEILSHRAKSPQALLYSMYRTVLEKRIGDMSEADAEAALGRFRHVVGSILVLASPLSRNTLSQMLSTSHDAIDNQLCTLHSVLNVPQSHTAPVNILHISFRDFLLAPKPDNQFRIDEKVAHATMATNCLRIMRDFLKTDICGLRRRGLGAAPPRRHEVDQAIPAAVQYACLHWAFHVQGAGHDVGTSRYDEAYAFLKCRFLQLIEALSLMDQASEGVRIMTRLRTMVKDGSELHAFLEDALRILRINISIIASAPLQIYCSVLLFTPRTSLVKQLFENEIPKLVCHRHRAEMDSDWNVLIHILGGNGSVAFSHDSSLIASVIQSPSSTIRLWNAETGECSQELTFESSGVTVLAFSRDSKLLVTLDNSGIDVWRVDTGECVQKINLCERALSVTHPFTTTTMEAGFVFSRDSLLFLLALGPHEATRLPQMHEIKVDGCAELEGISGTWRSRGLRREGFSRDLSLIARSENQTVRLLRVDTGECVQELKVHYDYMLDMVFSHDSSLIASYSGNPRIASYEPSSTVRVWRVVTGECVMRFEVPPPDPPLVFAFSHDSSLFATSSRHRSVYIWRIDTGECIQELRGHSRDINFIAFSHDSSLIASAAIDKTVRVWRVGACRRVQRVSKNRFWRLKIGPRNFRYLLSPKIVLPSISERPLGILAMSLDLSLMAMTPRSRHREAGRTTYRTVRAIELYHVDTGKRLYTLTTLDSPKRLAFSHDSARLASWYSDGSIQLWRTDTGRCVRLLCNPNWPASQDVAGSRPYESPAETSFRLGASQARKRRRVRRRRFWRAGMGPRVQNVTLDGRVLIGTESEDTESESHESESHDVELPTDVGTLTFFMPGLGSFWNLNGSQFGISPAFTWITHNGSNLLWLPDDLECTRVAVSGTTVAVLSGTIPARTALFSFSKNSHDWRWWMGQHLSDLDDSSATKTKQAGVAAVDLSRIELDEDGRCEKSGVALESNCKSAKGSRLCSGEPTFGGDSSNSASR